MRAKVTDHETHAQARPRRHPSDVSLAAPVAAGPFEDAGAAYDKGDYATALRLWRPMAEQGNAAAQFNLGQVY
jgi:TPR repeat protein